MKKAGMTFLAFLMFGALLLAASGCGSSSSDGGSSGSGAVSSSGNTAEVKLQGSKFTPADLTVEKGTTVTWSNDDSTTHTVTANNKAFDSGMLNKGQNFGYTFNESGTFEYACTIHSSMKGKVTVK